MVFLPNKAQQGFGSELFGYYRNIFIHIKNGELVKRLNLEIISSSRYFFPFGKYINSIEYYEVSGIRRLSSCTFLY